ncbi:uncharacterized protein ACNS7B_006816 [Menidia menidia]
MSNYGGRLASQFYLHLLAFVVCLSVKSGSYFRLLEGLFRQDVAGFLCVFPEAKPGVYRPKLTRGARAASGAMAELDPLLSSFQSQLSEVMEAVVRGAVLEVTRLVEDVFLREVRRRRREAESLRRRLRWTEAGRDIPEDQDPPGDIFGGCDAKRQADSVESWMSNHRSGSPDRPQDTEEDDLMPPVDLKEENSEKSCSSEDFRAWKGSRDGSAGPESEEAEAPKPTHRENEDSLRTFFKQDAELSGFCPDQQGAPDPQRPGTQGGNQGGNLGEHLGGSLGGNCPRTQGGNLGGNHPGTMGGSLGGNQVGKLGGNLVGSLGGSCSGTQGGNLGVNLGVNQGGNHPGTMGGSPGGIKGGNQGGNQVGSLGGSLGGSCPRTQGGSLGGNLGGNQGGIKGGNLVGSLGGKLGVNHGGIEGGCLGGNQGGSCPRTQGGNQEGNLGGSLGGIKGGNLGESMGGNQGGSLGLNCPRTQGGNQSGIKGGSLVGNLGGSLGVNHEGIKGGSLGGILGGNHPGTQGGSLVGVTIKEEAPDSDGCEEEFGSGGGAPEEEASVSVATRRRPAPPAPPTTSILSTKTLQEVLKLQSQGFPGRLPATSHSHLGPAAAPPLPLATAPGGVGVAVGARHLLRCGQCGKCFPHPSNLKTHLQTHSGERPFGCALCGRRFTKLSNLKAHRRVHTGERPYCCPACGKRFTQKCNLKRHQRIHLEA